MKKKILIVGGVAGGATFAARMRRLDENAEIIMFEKDKHIAFANCGLPYYIGGVITNREKLKVQTVENMSKRYAIDIRNYSEVIAINAEEKSVTVKNHKTGETYEETFDKLVLSPGANPIVPSFAGLKSASNVFTVRNIPDTDKIKEYVDNHEINDAVVIGGGFIGVEMAENLAHLGINVKLIEMADHILKPFDQEMAAMLEMNLKNNNVEILTSTKVADVKQDEIVLSDGTALKTDITIMAIGVRPSTKFLENTKLEFTRNGAIIVNEKFETNLEGIYALGDAIEVTNPIVNNKMHIPLAWPANRQARLLADIIAGFDKKYNGTIGASVLKVNELTAASVGLTEEFLKFNNIEAKSVIVHRSCHAGYYPNSSMITLKLVFGEDGKIYGAQAIGQSGVEKRIDVIATAIKFGASVDELEEIEVCYAPPFNSAKDPVNVAGYTAANVLQGFSKKFNYDQIQSILEDENKVLIDVRSQVEFDANNIEGSINIAVDDIRDNINGFEQYREKEIYVYCAVGHRGYIAQKILNANGFDNVFNLSGGLNTYKIVKQNENKKKSKNEKINEMKFENIQADYKLDACGMQCPGPIMATSKKMEELNPGETLEISVTDGGFIEDIKSWCEKCNNELLVNEYRDGKHVVVIRKSGEGVCKINPDINKDSGTIVMFSGDMDKALAAMIIAQGAQAMGKQMTIFFTFWGLNMLRKDEKVTVDKTNFEKMFGAMMPKGAEKMSISNMNMGGMGTKMIKSRMEDKNVPSLKEQILNAQAAGVKFIACTMSMDLMGISEVELIDGVDFGGVAKYVGESTGADLTLFI